MADAAESAAVAEVDLSGGNPFKNKDGRYKTITQMKGEPIGDALDYSFASMGSVEDMLTTEPVSGAVKGGGRPPTTCVRAPNNSILSLAGLGTVLDELVDDPSQLFWLDMSCNQIGELGDALSRFPRLRVLNLHGNNIATIAELKKICKLPLKSLTIHGNPVEEKKSIREFLISSIPTLEKLNFCPVTPRDRDGAMTWHKINIAGRARRKEQQ